MKKKLFVFLMLSVTLLNAEVKTIGNPSNPNFPMDGEGRVYHVGLKKGEIANRILLVGDPHRAKLIANILDHPEDAFVYQSNRGFLTYTGTFEGKPVSIVSIGMGLPMIDFAVREIRAITEGPLYMIRLGTCGTPNLDVEVGTLITAKDSFCLRTNYDAYHHQNELPYFQKTAPISSDLPLHKALMNSLKEESQGTFSVVEMTDMTTDFFYSSQGRIDPQFADKNTDLIDNVLKDYPDVGSLQMETYHLFHLAALAKYAKQDPIHVAACAIALGHRKSGAFLSNDQKYILEVAAGKACLKALLQ